MIDTTTKRCNEKKYTTFKIAGNISKQYPKKSYNLKFGSKKKIRLNAEYYDNTLMRNNLAQLLADPKFKAKYVDVWIDGSYQGLYSLCQKPQGIECYESMDQTKIVTRDDNLNNHFVKMGAYNYKQLEKYFVLYLTYRIDIKL